MNHKNKTEIRDWNPELKKPGESGDPPNIKFKKKSFKTPNFSDKNPGFRGGNDSRRNHPESDGILDTTQFGKL